MRKDKERAARERGFRELEGAAQRGISDEFVFFAAPTEPAPGLLIPVSDIEDLGLVPSGDVVELGLEEQDGDTVFCDEQHRYFEYQ